MVPSQGDISNELRAIFTEQLPVHLLGMVHGALVFIGSEMLLVVTNIRFGIKSRNFAANRELIDPTRNPFHELSMATGKATKSVTQGIAALREVMGEYRENIVSSMEKLQDGSLEMHQLHFAEVQDVTAECSRLVEAIRDATNESGTIQPLLTTLSECTDRLSQQARELQSQVATLDPRAFATGAAEAGESSRKIQENIRETNKLLVEKLDVISGSLGWTTALTTENLGSIVTVLQELAEKLGSSEGASISGDDRSGKKTTRGSTDPGGKSVRRSENPDYLKTIERAEIEGQSFRKKPGP
ncbi:hypothetical protein OAJ60_04945 [Planctomycetaceae bacterium]|nr:hypothetical protein [Planctomycetaceae bacterium]